MPFRVGDKRCAGEETRSLLSSPPSKSVSLFFYLYFSVRTHNTRSEHDIISDRDYRFRLTLAVTSLAPLVEQLLYCCCCYISDPFRGPFTSCCILFFVVSSSFALKSFFLSSSENTSHAVSFLPKMAHFFKAIIGSFGQTKKYIQMEERTGKQKRAKRGKQQTSSTRCRLSTPAPTCNHISCWQNPERFQLIRIISRFQVFRLANRITWVEQGEGGGGGVEAG